MEGKEEVWAEENLSKEVAEKTATHLWALAGSTSVQSTQLRGSFGFQAKDILEDSGESGFPVRCERTCCSQCGLPFVSSDSFTASVLPKAIPGGRLLKIQRRERRGKRLSKFELTLLKRFKKEQSVRLQIQCAVCRTKKLIPFRAGETQTPAAPIGGKLLPSPAVIGQKISQSPSSTLTSPNLGSSRKKRKGASRLQEMIRRENQQESPKSGTSSGLGAFLDALGSV